MMKSSPFNIVLSSFDRNILMNYFTGSIDEITRELEDIIEEENFKKIESESDKEYLIQRGYIRNRPESVSRIPKPRITRNKDDSYRICFKDESRNVFMVPGISLINSPPPGPGKLIIVDKAENINLLSDKTEIIDTVLQDARFVELNMVFTQDNISLMDSVFKFLIRMGWVFLHNFSCCILSSDYSGCPLGRIHGYSPDFVEKIFAFRADKKYLEYLSLKKLLGANLIEFYLWHKHITPDLVFCKYYDPKDNGADPVSWITCRGCSFDRKGGEFQTDIYARMKQDAQFCLHSYRDEIFSR